MPKVVILDCGLEVPHKLKSALEVSGASVEISSDFETALNADAIVLASDGAFADCVAEVVKVRGDQIIGRRLAGGRPVLGIGTGMQALFEGCSQDSIGGYLPGLNEWPGTVAQLSAPLTSKAEWMSVSAPLGSEMFRGATGEQFYFTNSFGVKNWELNPAENLRAPLVSWANLGDDFVAAVENGPLWTTQFHPEDSGEAGLTLLANWISKIN